MNKIIKHTGEYLTSSFKGKTGTFDIVSTESGNGGPLTCVDTFKNRSTGELIKRERSKIWEWAEAKKISPDIEETKTSTKARKAA